MLQNRILEKILPTRAQLWISIPFYFLIQKSFRCNLPLLDFWWHLKMGQVILDTGTIPRFDAFSYTAAGKLFILQNWLAEIVLYVVYKAGGFALLIFFNTALLCTALVITFILCRQRSQSLWMSILATTIIAICLPCNLRPQVFSLPLFAVFYFLLMKFRSAESREIYWLPFLMIIWVNLHGAFVLGLALIGIFAIEQAVQFYINPDVVKDSGRIKICRLGIILVLCLIATIANPEGYRVYSYIRTVVQDPSSRLFVSEWQPPVISDITGFLVFYFMFFLTTIALIVSKRRPQLIDLMLYLGFSIFGIMAMRNCVWFLLISAPILSRHLSSIYWEWLPDQWRIRSTNKPSSTTPAKNPLYQYLNFAIAIMMVIIAGVLSPWSRNIQPNDSLFDSQTPIGAVNYISKKNLQGNIFHPQIYGDYMLWKLWPRQRVFFDGRVHLYGEDLVRTYLRIYEDSDWDDRLAALKVRYLLLSKDEEKKDKKGLIGRVRQSKKWRIIYEDRVSILWEKYTTS